MPANTGQDISHLLGFLLRRWRHVATFQSVSGVPVANMPRTSESSAGMSSCLFPVRCNVQRGDLTKACWAWDCAALSLAGTGLNNGGGPSNEPGI